MAESLIPGTYEGLAALVDMRPDYWEYRLYLGLVQRGMWTADEVLERRLARGESLGKVFTEHDEAAKFLAKQTKAAKKLPIRFFEAFNDAFSSSAFGPPGQPGDAAGITELANRAVRRYEDLLDWIAKMRSISTNIPEFWDVVGVVAELYEAAPPKMLGMVQEVITKFDKALELSNASTDGGSSPIILDDINVVLSSPPGWDARFEKSFRAFENVPLRIARVSNSEATRVYRPSPRPVVAKQEVVPDVELEKVALQALAELEEALQQIDQELGFAEARFGHHGIRDLRAEYREIQAEYQKLLDLRRLRSTESAYNISWQKDRDRLKLLVGRCRALLGTELLTRPADQAKRLAEVEQSLADSLGRLANASEVYRVLSKTPLSENLIGTVDAIAEATNMLQGCDDVLTLVRKKLAAGDHSVIDPLLTAAQTMLSDADAQLDKTEASWSQSGA